MIPAIPGQPRDSHHQKVQNKENPVKWRSSRSTDYWGSSGPLPSEHCHGLRRTTDPRQTRVPIACIHPSVAQIAIQVWWPRWATFYFTHQRKPDREGSESPRALEILVMTQTHHVIGLSKAGTEFIGARGQRAWAKCRKALGVMCLMSADSTRATHVLPNKQGSAWLNQPMISAEGAAMFVQSCPHLARISFFSCLPFPSDAPCGLPTLFGTSA